MNRVGDGAVGSVKSGTPASPVVSGGHIIQDNGVDQAARNKLNFVGAAITDDSETDATVVTIDANSAPNGGLAGQVLSKVSDADGDVAWAALSSGILVNLVSTMTAANTPSPFVVSSNEYDPGYNGWLAFDGNYTDPAQCWHDVYGSSKNGDWLKVDLGAADVVNVYRITAQNNSSVGAARAPRDFKLQGSNDDSTWIDLNTQASITWAAGETKEFAFYNSTAYRYYRLYITANGGNAYLCVQEMSLHKYVAASVSSTPIAQNIILTEDGSSVVFDGLDLNSDGGSYTISAEFTSGATSGELKAAINGDTTAAHYNRHGTQDYNSANVSESASNSNGYTNFRGDGVVFKIEGIIKLIQGLAVVSLEVLTLNTPSLPILHEKWVLLYKNSVDNITEFSLYGPTNSFKAGAKFTLYKTRLAGQI